MSVDLEAEVKALREEVHELKHQVVTDFMSHIKEQQKQISSRRGEVGPRGDSIVGPAGRDMVLIVKTDTATNTIHVFDESRNEKATIIAVPGKDGRDGISPTPKNGVDGRNGKDAPSLSEIVAAVMEAIRTRFNQ
jgi:hypothetical protein